MIITNDIDEYSMLTSLSRLFECYCNEVEKERDGKCSECDVKDVCYLLACLPNDCEIKYKEKL